MSANADGTTDVPILETDGLTRRFGDLCAVDDVDLSIPQGEFHSIIGPNGAGKTTLFNLIAGSMPASDGVIRFRGRDVAGDDEDDRARDGIVRAFQITQLFPALSIHENLRLAAQSTRQNRNPIAAMDQETVARADETYADLDIDAAPTATAETLSHGDKKKLEIGMALLADPDLLLLDEPTSGVSQAESGQIVDLVDQVTDTTVLLIEHDVDLVLDLSDRITVLHQGERLATGPPEAITSNEDVQRAYLGGY
jgi:branched-chain amino acid transport system ATP-binding protein